jgi:hypothetical protein
MRLEDLRALRGTLDALTDDELRSLVGDEPSRGSWAWTGVGDLDGTSLFVKRVPVTDIEVAAWPSTRNHFELPLSYQYGVGSAGFGAAREVAAHRAVSDWVLAGDTDAFTVLLHSRLMPRASEPWQMPVERERYLAMWGDDARIAAYIDARVAAEHEVWMVSEHVPHQLARWLPTHQDQIDGVLSTLLDAASIMRERGMVHFDAHLANAVVDDDGTRICLVDHGLAMLDTFELASGERELLAAHRHFDAGEVLVGAAVVARSASAQDVPVEPALAAAVERYRPVVELMGGFFTALAEDPDKRARHDDEELVARLRACGVATER